MMAVLGFILMFAIGLPAVKLADPAGGRGPRWAAVTLEIALACGLGAGVTGVMYFLVVVAGAGNRWVVLGAEAALAALLWLVWWRRRNTVGAAEGAAPETGWRWNPVLLGVVAFTLLIALLVQVDTLRASPYGQWDAFTVWNLRARFLAGPGDAWQFAVSRIAASAQPECPPLLSAFVARGWTLGGDTTTPVVPGAIALLFYWMTAATLGASVALTRTVSGGLLALLVFGATKSIIQQATWQYPDVPLGCFLLGSFALLAVSSRPGPVALAGAFASLAALLKNEGTVYLAAITIGYLGFSWWREGRAEMWRRARWWLAGAAPGILLLAGFKLFLAPDTGPFAGQTAAQIGARLLQVERASRLGVLLLEELAKLGWGVSHPLVLLIILAAGLRFSRAPRARLAAGAGFAMLALAALLCSGLHVAMPNSALAGVRASMTSMYTHLWPAFLMVTFLALRPPRTEAADQAADETAAGDRKHKGNKKKRR